MKRIFDIKSNKNKPRDDKYLHKMINKFVIKDNCQKLNYALLDFASIICKKRNPKCQGCSVSEICLYYNS